MSNWENSENLQHWTEGEFNQIYAFYYNLIFKCSYR
jgi:hypothetical protein